MERPLDFLRQAKPGQKSPLYPTCCLSEEVREIARLREGKCLPPVPNLLRDLTEKDHSVHPSEDARLVLNDLARQP